MTDRDHFAAAALTGLIANGDYSVESTPILAWRMADAMLRERERTNHDAAPAARATEPEPSAARRRPAGGTGDTPLAAGRRACGSSEQAASSQAASNPLPCGTASAGTDGRPAAAAAYTPQTHITQGECSKPRDGTSEPVAWAAYCEGVYDSSFCGSFDAKNEAEEWCNELRFENGRDWVAVPLYSRPQPTLTATEAETLRELRDEAAQYADEIGLTSSEIRVRQRIIDGLLERLA